MKINVIYYLTLLISRNKFLQIIQQNKLSRLQEEVDDNLGLVLFGEDGYHKDAIVNSVNDFLKVV